METPIALHNVAHRVSHQIPSDIEMSRQNRATPPQIKVSHLSPDPPVALSSHSQAGGAEGWWRVSRPFLGSENGSRYRGLSQLQSHQSRYSVQLRSRKCPKSLNSLECSLDTGRILLCFPYSGNSLASLESLYSPENL